MNQIISILNFSWIKYFVSDSFLLYRENWLLFQKNALIWMILLSSIDQRVMNNAHFWIEKQKRVQNIVLIHIRLVRGVSYFPNKAVEETLHVFRVAFYSKFWIFQNLSNKEKNTFKTYWNKGGGSNLDHLIRKNDFESNTFSKVRN